MSVFTPIRAAILGTAVVVMSACAGKEGPTGPQGPVGAQGQPGSPNVIYSAWFTPTRYDTVTVFGLRNFNHVQAAPQITQAILDNGVVLTYGKLTGYNSTVWPTNQVGQLPISVKYQQGGLQIDTWSGYATPGSLRINFVNSANIYTTIANTHSFRYIIIPGGVASTNVLPSGGVLGNRIPSETRYTREQLQQLSYDDVRQLFGIPEN